MTFTADGAACANLPAQARRRTYTSTWSAGVTLAHLTSATFFTTGVDFPMWNVLYLKFSGGYTNASDILSEAWFQDPPIWEALSDDSYLVIFGGPAVGEVAGEYARMPFWGRFEYCSDRKLAAEPACEVPAITCVSTNHQLTVRQK